MMMSGIIFPGQNSPSLSRVVPLKAISSSLSSAPLKEPEPLRLSLESVDSMSALSLISLPATGASIFSYNVIDLKNATYYYYTFPKL